MEKIIFASEHSIWNSEDKYLSKDINASYYSALDIFNEKNTLLIDKKDEITLCDKDDNARKIDWWKIHNKEEIIDKIIKPFNF